tara:strand:+ start:2486 stop:3241 length:756 start_codon:yes stop_codon:yes gene_type:complete
MSDKLKQLQCDFSHASRGHEQTQSPKFDERKLAIYQRLLLNNLNEVISPCFPVLLSILPANTWRDILKDFLKRYCVTTPIFHELPSFMVKYLKHHPIADYPFAYELSHYEWIELEVELSEPEKKQSYTGEISLLEQVWRLSNTARLLEYSYEVDKICPDYQPHKKIKTYLIAYQIEDKVAFLKLNELSFQLLSMMLKESMSIKEIILLLCEAHPQFNEVDLVSACIPLITQLFDEKILHPTHNTLKANEHD